MNTWKNSEQFFLLINNMKHTIFIIIGIILFVLLNDVNRFSVGGNTVEFFFLDHNLKDIYNKIKPELDSLENLGMRTQDLAELTAVLHITEAEAKRRELIDKLNSEELRRLHTILQGAFNRTLDRFERQAE